MKVLCLCPIFGKPMSVIQNTLALFSMQSHPADERHLLLYDDSGNFTMEQRGANWSLFVSEEREYSLPHKYQRMLDDFVPEVFTDWEAVIPWDDDDVYCPWFMEDHIRALATVPDERKAGISIPPFSWSKASKIWSNYDPPVGIEDSAGRFHGSCFFTRSAIEGVGHWLGVMDKGRERAANFDQRLIAAVTTKHVPGDPWYVTHVPSYVYRWRVHNCSFLMKSPDDETWWTEYPKALEPRDFVRPFDSCLTPELDVETKWLLEYAQRQHDLLEPTE